MKKLVFFLIALFSFGSPLFAQDGESESKHFIGVAAGTTSGLGLMYQYKPNRLSIQGVFFPNVQKNRAFISGGLNFQYDLKSYPYFDLYLFENNRIIYSESSYSSTNYSYKNIERNFAHGVGLGLRLSPLEHFGFSIGSGFGVYNYDTYTLSIDAALYFKI